MWNQWEVRRRREQQRPEKMTRTTKKQTRTEQMVEKCCVIYVSIAFRSQRIHSFIHLVCHSDTKPPWRLLMSSADAHVEFVYFSGVKCSVFFCAVLFILISFWSPPPNLRLRICTKGHTHLFCSSFFFLSLHFVRGVGTVCAFGQIMVSSLSLFLVPTLCFSLTSLPPHKNMVVEHGNKEKKKKCQNNGRKTEKIKTLVTLFCAAQKSTEM